MSTDEGRNLSQVVEQAISAVLDQAGYLMAGRWVLAVEVIEKESGERSIWLLSPRDQKVWDTLGLLTFAIQLEQANIINSSDSE